ncbi:cytoplasmic intermediate filament protein [Saccoglossus kowalevskii]|uniref:Cytoplasmic intermediate filament protein n=1 Tax=Saccoglossus kowalevskii TaxID=10224 RepID=Q8MYK2_SACKO|nr:cytoplasmic intermediate filament protein [Saccoglossus kowalevskii]CAD13470.1 cytoplasmic intermediate filament protein [Saccoglossus kowalevskii]
MISSGDAEEEPEKPEVKDDRRGSSSSSSSSSSDEDESASLKEKIDVEKSVDISKEAKQRSLEDEVENRRTRDKDVSLARHYEGELRILNERLACYVDVVGKIETGDERVKKVWGKLNTSEERVANAIGDLKDEYEISLRDIRELIKTINEERQQNDDERDDRNKKIGDLRAELKSVEIDSANKTVEVKTINLEKDTLNEEVASKAKALAAARKIAEQERKLREELESTFRKEMSLQDEIEKQWEEIKMAKKQIISGILDQDKKAAEEEKMKLKATLQKWSEHYSEELKKYKKTIENEYGFELKKMRRQVDEFKSRSNATEYELKLALLKIGEMDDQHRSVLAKIGFMEERVQELEERKKKLLEDQERQFGLIREKDEEIRELLNRLDRQAREFAEAERDRILLDKEIAKFRKLLEMEENRLNLDEMEMEEQKSSFEISIDVSKKSVKIVNKGDSDQTLEGYKLRRSKGGRDFNFSFKSGQVLRAGSSMTIKMKGQTVNKDDDEDEWDDMSDISDDESETCLVDTSGTVKTTHFSKSKRVLEYA